jgi:hypothetical protein
VNVCREEGGTDTGADTGTDTGTWHGTGTVIAGRMAAQIKRERAVGFNLTEIN